MKFINFLSIIHVQAQAVVPTVTIVDSKTDASVLMQQTVDWMVYLGGAAAVLFLVYSGNMYITSGGDTEKASQAKAGVVNAVIGIILIALAYAIVTWVTHIASGSSPANI